MDLIHHIQGQLGDIHLQRNRTDGILRQGLQQAHLLDVECQFIAVFPLRTHPAFDENRRLVDEILPPVGEILAEERQFVSPSEVLYGQYPEILAVLGLPHPLRRDDACNRELLPLEVLQTGIQFVQRGAQHLHLQLIKVQRVGGQIDADQVLLILRLLIVVPRLTIRNHGLRHLERLHVPEEGSLHAHRILLRLLPVVHQSLQHAHIAVHVEILRAVVPEAVQPSRHHQGLQRLLIDGAVVDALEKIIDILIRSVLLPLLDNLLHRRLSHALDGSHAETDLPVGIDGKVIV